MQETPRKLVNMYLSKYLLLNGYSNQINTWSFQIHGMNWDKFWILGELAWDDP